MLEEVLRGVVPMELRMAMRDLCLQTKMGQETNNLDPQAHLPLKLHQKNVNSKREGSKVSVIDVIALNRNHLRVQREVVISNSHPKLPISVLQGALRQWMRTMYEIDKKLIVDKPLE
jgi:hypothetical protein